MQGNKGIVVTGSAQVNAGAMAAGDGARAENNAAVPAASPQVAELRTQLAELIAMMRASAALPDAGDLVEAASQADRELVKDQPNKHILAGLLGGLAGGVAHVADLAEAVGRIQHAMSVLF